LEEIRCTLTFLDWRARWWRDQAFCCAAEPAPLQEGIRAYAEQQADMWEAIASGHAKYWLAELESKGIDPEWQERYFPVATSQIPGTVIPPSPDTTIPSTTIMDEEHILENVADPSDYEEKNDDELNVDDNDVDDDFEWDLW
jgi:hypothetical protein